MSKSYIVHITDKQNDFIEDNGYNLSIIVRSAIQELINGDIK